MKFRKLFFIFIIICCICVLSGLGASPKLFAFYGKYVCSENKDSVIEFLDFAIPQRIATVNFCNINFPTHDIKNYSKNNATAKVYRKKGKKLFFSTMIDGKKVTGFLDIEKKMVKLDGIVYVRE